LAKILKGLSHDSVNRFYYENMNQKTCSVKSNHIQLLGGTLSVDDTVIDKPYSNPNLTELIGYFGRASIIESLKG